MRGAVGEQGVAGALDGSIDGGKKRLAIGLRRHLQIERRVAGHGRERITGEAIGSGGQILLAIHHHAYQEPCIVGLGAHHFDPGRQIAAPIGANNGIAAAIGTHRAGAEDGDHIARDAHQRGGMIALQRRDREEHRAL